MASLVGEIVLSCKEVNQKTRGAANDILVDVAHAMHDASPPSLDPSACPATNMRLLPTNHLMLFCAAT